MKLCLAVVINAARYFLNGGIPVILAMSLIGATGAGCKSTRLVNGPGIKLNQDFCLSSSASEFWEFTPIHANTDSLLGSPGGLNVFLTKQDILASNAAGVLDYIQEIIGLGKDSSRFAQALFFEYVIGIQKNLDLVKSHIDALSAELECESFRTRQLSSYLGNKNSKRTSKLTVGAIAVGSLTTALPALVTATTPADIIAIGGGAATLGLGLLTLNPDWYQLKMSTSRNLLGNIWFGDSVKVIYPPSVWYFLSEPGFGDLQGLSKAQVLKMRWLKFELNNSADKTTETLLFGDGGVFGQGDLDTKATMLSELSVEVNSLNQYLDILSYKINTIQLSVLRNKR
ncbi:MAG: hypothetical protein ABWZ25_19130 [Chitinophagaceae bacterium]